MMKIDNTDQAALALGERMEHLAIEGQPANMTASARERLPRGFWGLECPRSSVPYFTHGSSRVALGAVLVASLAALGMAADPAAAEGPGVRVATFDVEATPPIGTMMAYRPATHAAELPLRCRGVVVLGAGSPIVLGAIDWIGVANEAHDAFRASLAAAAGTTADRVAFHAVHQHDAPFCDFTGERIARELGCPDAVRSAGDFARDVMRRAEAEGLVDPFVAALSLWHDDVPLAVITTYACHPQSYYGTGVPSPDFPGIARFIRTQDLPAALHVHFNGAGGNVTAGKYNDGSPANRIRLATRLAAGMRQAFEATVRQPLAAADVGWGSVAVALEPAAHLDDAALVAALTERPQARESRRAVDRLAWLRRAAGGHRILVSCLRVGQAQMLHLPGELFVEYQLAAQAMRPDEPVLLAAYADYGPGYIGTAAAYAAGGYETEPTSSFVDPEAEPRLLDAIRSLLTTEP
jgi:hypothetical protein